MEIDPLNPKKALNDLKFDIIVPSGVKAFQALEKEIEGKHFRFKNRRSTVSPVVWKREWWAKRVQTEDIWRPQDIT